MTTEFEINLLPLAVGTIISFLSVHSTFVEKPVFKLLNMKTGKERTLLSQRQALKREQSLINMVDEFAKYSKVQRRINQIDIELQNIKGSKPMNSVFAQLGFTYGVKFILVLLLVILSIYYRNTPVLYLGEKINLTPFTTFICYPNETNYVSFYFWVMCTASVARLL